MKKYILLLLLATFGMQAQTLQNPTFGNLKLKNNQTSTTATKVNVQENDGTINTKPLSELDNYLEFASAVNLPVTGEQGKLYLTKDNNRLYRFNGTIYQEISADETTATIQAKRPLKTIENQSLEGSGNIDLSKSDVGLGNVDNTSDANKPISTATQTALNGKENSFTKNTAFNKNFGTTAGTVVEGGTLGSNAYSSTAFLPLSGGNISGSVGIGTTSPNRKLEVADIDSQFSLKGTISGAPVYQTWYNSSNVRRGYFGFASESSSDIRLVNEEVGNIYISPNNGSTIVLSTLTASPATLPNHVVVKSQLDAVVVRPYKVYTALLNQTGTNAPVATVLENTLGVTVSWSYGGAAGNYVFTAPSGTFPINKSICFATRPNETASGSRSDVIITAGTNNITTDNGSVQVFETSTNTRIDGALVRMAFEIRVYN